MQVNQKFRTLKVSEERKQIKFDPSTKMESQLKHESKTQFYHDNQPSNCFERHQFNDFLKITLKPHEHCTPFQDGKILQDPSLSSGVFATHGLS